MLWADEEKLIGQTFEFEEDEKKLLNGEGVLANLSKLDKAENKFEIQAGETEPAAGLLRLEDPVGHTDDRRDLLPSQPCRREGVGPTT